MCVYMSGDYRADPGIYRKPYARGLHTVTHRQLTEIQNAGVILRKGPALHTNAIGLGTGLSLSSFLHPLTLNEMNVRAWGFIHQGTLA